MFFILLTIKMPNSLLVIILFTNKLLGTCALGIEAFVEALPIFYREATAESPTLKG